MREDGSNGESSSDSNVDKRIKKKNGKTKKVDITKDDLKALKQKIDELAIDAQKVRTGVTCQSGRNECHYANECQLKTCSNCNSIVHNTSECIYEINDGRRQKKKYGVNQVQSQLNNNRRRFKIAPP